MNVSITTPQFEELKRLLQNDDDILRLQDMQSVMDLATMTFALTKRLATALEKESQKNERLTRSLERFREKDNAAAALGEFQTLDLDSLLVARILLSELRNLNAWKLTLSKLEYILFDVYANCLLSLKTRIFAEHPVVAGLTEEDGTKKDVGPRFWRVHTKLQLASGASGAEMYAFKQNFPSVAAIMHNVAVKYADLNERDIFRVVTMNDAYKSALPDKNAGKWNGEIQDSKIYFWKKDSRSLK